MGTYLRSPEATAFDMSQHSWDKVVAGSQWLRANNPLIRSLCPELSVCLEEVGAIGNVGLGGIEMADLVNPEEEAAVPAERPDLVLNPADFEAEVRDEDYRSHRLPGGTIESSVTKLRAVINHGDTRLEMLLFPHLYPNGRGAWVYQGPCRARYVNVNRGQR